MQQLIDRLRKSQSITERPDYHPEGNLLRHIGIVTLRGYFSGIPELMIAGLFHDICKGDSGDYHQYDTGSFWRNTDHPKMAEELVLSDDISYFLREFVNVQNVAAICRYHEACKDSIIRKAAGISNIEKFVTFDDMIERQRFPKSRGNFYIPRFGGGEMEIGFIGQSLLQRIRNLQAFTVCAGNLPRTFAFDEIPEFFLQKKFYSERKSIQGETKMEYLASWVGNLFLEADIQ